jgi:hypothetical protein
LSTYDLAHVLGKAGVTHPLTPAALQKMSDSSEIITSAMPTGVPINVLGRSARRAA